MNFRLESPFSPAGDQPQAIEALIKGFETGKNRQVLLGITGSGKTFTMANVIQALKRPTLILAHNKTLAAQLYQEFKALFPDNAVEYFVSYYDYYQPEAYIPRSDTFIEKDFQINDEIDKLRLSATRSLLEREDVIIVASVSCIYGLGSPDYYKGMNLAVKRGATFRRDDFLLRLIEMKYNRSEYDLSRSTFRVRGEVIDIYAAYEEDRAYRIEFFGDEVERISIIDPLLGKSLQRIEEFTLYPGSHYVTPQEVRHKALATIRAEMVERMAFFEKEEKHIERQRIFERTTYDMEMIKEIGFCKGIENYSRHFSGRAPGEPPPCLIDYFPKDFLLMIDESHQTIPQLNAMYNGDKARKKALVDFGFRLPSAYDNRPLKFEEVYQHFNRVLYVSATPSIWEKEEAELEIVEQIIRPTGLLDPPITVRPADGQVDDALEEIRKATLKGEKTLVTTLTKKLAEDLAGYLTEIGVRAKYLHSEIETLERLEIIRDLRENRFDVLVGINLLREGLDIPEVALVVILDADKQGFLRSETSLIQTCGRAARNANGRVLMYGNVVSSAMTHAIQETERRRVIQIEYNKKHGITPATVIRKVAPLLGEKGEALTTLQASVLDSGISQESLLKKISALREAMKKAAKEMHFEEAATLRDQMKEYEKLIL